MSSTQQETETEKKLNQILKEMQVIKEENKSMKTEIAELKQSVQKNFEFIIKLLTKSEEKVKKDEEKKKDIIGKTSLITKEAQIKLLSEALSNTKAFHGKQIKDLKFELIYSTATDPWSNNGFHSKCNNINNTLTIIKTNDDHVFGGFTTKTWNARQGALKDNKNAFVFSFVTNKFYPIIEGEKAILTSSNGPCFYSYANNMIQFDTNLKMGNTEIAQNSFYAGISKDYEINGGKYDFEVAQIDILKVSE